MSRPIDDDSELLRRYRRSDDQQAFAELVRRHVDLVYGTAFNEMGNHQDTEDVSQRVFTALAKKAKRLRIRRLSAWLYKSTRQEVLLMKRTEGRRRVREAKAAQLAEIQIEGEDLNAVEVNPVLVETMDQLPDHDQEALVLRFFEGKNFQQMGATLGIQQRAAQKRVYRAMERLRENLAKRGVTAATAALSTQLFGCSRFSAPPGMAHELSNTALIEASTGATATTLAGWIFKPGVLLSTAAIVVLSVGFIAASNLSSNNRSELPDPLLRSTSNDSETSNVRAPELVTSARIAIDDIEAIYRLDVSARDAAIVRLEKYLESKGERAYLADLFQRWTALDAPRCVQAQVTLVRANGNDRDRDDLLVECLTIPIASWHHQSSADLVHWIRNLPRTDRGEKHAFRAGVRVLADSDPKAGFELIAGRYGTSDSAYNSLAGAISSRSRKAIWTLLASLPDLDHPGSPPGSEEGAGFGDAGTRPWVRLIQAVLPYLYEDDRQATADWIVDLPETKQADVLTASFLELWGSEQPNEAIAWVMSLEPEAKDVLIPSLGKGWAKQSPDEALTWLIEDSGSSHPWEAALPAFREWVGSGTEATAKARHWLTPRVLNDGSAPLAALLSDSLDPHEALQWAHSLSSGRAKSTAYSHAFFAMGLTDSSSAKSALREELPADHQHAAAKALAEGVFVSEGRNSVHAWYRSAHKAGEEYAASILAGEVSVLAALNPMLVSKGVLGMPPGRNRDLVLNVLIDRTYQRSLEAAEQAEKWSGKLSHSDLRKSWVAKISKARETAPWKNRKELPAGLENGFESQTFGEFHDRLALLSTLPPKSRQKE